MAKNGDTSINFRPQTTAGSADPCIPEFKFLEGNPAPRSNGAACVTFFDKVELVTIGDHAWLHGTRRRDSCITEVRNFSLDEILKSTNSIDSPFDSVVVVVEVVDGWTVAVEVEAGGEAEAGFGDIGTAGSFSTSVQ